MKDKQEMATMIRGLLTSKGVSLEAGDHLLIDVCAEVAIMAMQAERDSTIALIDEQIETSYVLIAADDVLDSLHAQSAEIGIGTLKYLKELLEATQ